MNLVDLIRGHLSGDLLGKLAGHVGGEEAATRTAANTAVPSLLAVLAKLVASGDGASKLTSTLGKIDPSAVTHFGQSATAQGGGSLLEQGTGMLSSVVGDQLLSGLSGALSHFSGLSAASVKKLLAYLTPLVLGVVASQFKGKGVTAQGLTSLFEEQKDNIAHAIPSGLSLNNLPGMGSVGAVAHQAGATASHAAAAAQAGGSNMMMWLLPLLGVALLGLIALWWFFGRPPAGTHTGSLSTGSAEATKVGETVTGAIKSLTEVLGDVKDAKTAEEAFPKLKDVDEQLDKAKTAFEKLPAAGKAVVSAVVTSNLGKLKDLVKKVLETTGIGDKFKTAVEDVMKKLTAMGVEK